MAETAFRRSRGRANELKLQPGARIEASIQMLACGEIYLVPPPPPPPCTTAEIPAAANIATAGTTATVDVATHSDR